MSCNFSYKDSQFSNNFTRLFLLNLQFYDFKTSLPIICKCTRGLSYTLFDVTLSHNKMNLSLEAVDHPSELLFVNFNQDSS